MTWTTRLLPCSLAAAAALAATLAGCSPGGSVGTGPQSAARAHRGVIETKTESHAARTAPPAGPSVPDPIDQGLAGGVPVEPVAAPRPVTAGTSDSSVTLASAEGSTAPPVATPEPPLDPSQFPGGIIPASPNAKPLPGGPRLLVPAKTFRADGRPRALRVSYDDLDLLKVLNVDPVPLDVVDTFPDWLRDLDGKTVRLRGFMYPSYQEEQKAFVLTRDTGACCFGPDPKVYYLISVKMKEGTTARYVENRPIDVVGTFHIAPHVLDGKLIRIYRVSDAVLAD